MNTLEKLKTYLGEIEKNNQKGKKINAILQINPDCEKEAKIIDEKIKKGKAGKLAGKIIAVKSNINVKGLIASCASKTLENYKSTFDATVIKKIKQESSLVDFLEQAKENPELLENLMSKEEAEKLSKILKEKKEKEVIVKKKFSLKSEAEDGIVRIKKILPEDKNITYLAAGRFSIEIKNKDYKDANSKLLQILQDIEKKAKQEGCIFSVEK